MEGDTKPGPLSVLPGDGDTPPPPPRLLPGLERGGEVLRGGSAPWTEPPRQTAPLRPAAAPAAGKQAREKMPGLCLTGRVGQMCWGFF